MKKIYSICFLIFLFVQGISQSSRNESSYGPPSSLMTHPNNANHNLKDGLSYPSLHQLYDSTFVWDINLTSLEWQLTSKSIDFTYDSRYNLTGKVTQQWNGSTWLNQYRETLGYDDSSNMTFHLDETWNGSDWGNLIQSIYTYDGNTLISSLKQIWNGNEWENNHLCTYSYDANKNNILLLDQLWTGIAWRNLLQEFFTYNSNNDMTSWKTQSYVNDVWTDFSLRTNTYSADYKMESSLYQYWNNGAWENSRLSTYTYDLSGNLLNDFTQDWNGSGWVNYTTTNFGYDDDNNRKIEIVNKWNGTTWVKDRQNGFSYDEYSFLNSEVYRLWNIAGSDIIHGDSIYFYFHTNLGIPDLAESDPGFSLYPNPANSLFSISCNENISSVEVFNSLGEWIFSTGPVPGRRIEKIDLSGVSGGIYLLKITSGLKVFTKKIVIL